MKRKYCDSSRGEENASAGPAMDISMSTSSKEGRFRTIKREEESTGWSCNAMVDFSNSSLSTSFASKEEQSSEVEEQALSIKREEDA